MDFFEQELGSTLIESVIGLVMLHYILDSDLLRTIGKIILLILLGGILIGIPTFVIFNIHLPNDHYFQAIFVAIIGYGMAVPWFIWGLPELISTTKDFKQESGLAKNKK